MANMDSEILFYTASYITVRMATLLCFGYALWRIVRPERARVRSLGTQVSDARRPSPVLDDRC